MSMHNDAFNRLREAGNEPRPPHKYLVGIDVLTPNGKRRIVRHWGHSKRGNEIWKPNYACLPLKKDGTLDKRSEHRLARNTFTEDEITPIQ